MTPERLDTIRRGLVLSRAHVRRGQVPSTFLARMDDLDRADHAHISRHCPDIVEGLRTLTREIALMRASKAQQRDPWER